MIKTIKYMDGNDRSRSDNSEWLWLSVVGKVTLDQAPGREDKTSSKLSRTLVLMNFGIWNEDLQWFSNNVVAGPQTSKSQKYR